MSQRLFKSNAPLLFHFLMRLFVIFNILLNVNGYCWLPGRNPSFVAGPTITQINLAKVQVSWKGIVRSKECVDQFLVKYWKDGQPSNYKQSDLVGTSINAVVLTGIIPKVEYAYQVIAREDKLVGIDYNRSPTTKFATSQKHVQNFDIYKNATSLNVVSVGSHKANDKYNPGINVIEGNQNDITSSKSKTDSGIIAQKYPASSIADFKRSFGEENSNVIFILALVALAMFALIIIVGVTYNCIKRLYKRNQTETDSDDSN